MMRIKREWVDLAHGITLPLFAAGTASADKVTSRIRSAGVKPATFSEEQRAEVNKAFDAVVLRPLDAGALLCGAVLMVPAATFGLMGGTEPVEDAWDLLVLTSWESLVDRPLGHWGS